ncbi:MAG TPA: LysR family transcriptional regulator [Casimicrobiaceae bacterium]|nr:LysR family transcriptional regulator [Casimicrobiaceae bacterium]
MDAHWLRAFAHVARLGSFSRAAVMLGTTQSAVSKQVSELERALEARLFDRTGRGAVPTEVGRMLLPKAEALVEALDGLPAELRNAQASPAGTVHVGVLPSVARPLVSRVFERVRARHPAIRLHVLGGVTGQIEEWLAQGRLDIGIVNRYRRSPHEKVEHLFTPALYLVGSPRNRITRGGRVRFAQLAALPLILPGVPHGLRMVIEEAASRRRMALSVIMEVDSLALIKDIIGEGDCVTVTAGHSVTSEVAEGKLSASRIVQPELHQSIMLATSATRAQTLAVRTVLDIVREVARELIRSGIWTHGTR